MKIKYHVNEEKKTITCIAENCTRDACDEVLQNGQLSQLPLSARQLLGYFLELGQKYHMPDKFVATVTCSPEDYFIKKKGKDIAYHKLMVKYHKAKQKALENLMEDFNTLKFYAQKLAYDEDTKEGFHFRKFYENK